jgi:hypothetical protein
MKSVSGWTIKSLKEYFLTLFAERERQAELRQTTSQMAIDKAERAMTLRLEQMNEFRAQMQQERATFATRDSVQVFDDRVGRIEVAQSNLRGQILGFSAAASIAAILIDLLLRALGH